MTEEHVAEHVEEVAEEVVEEVVETHEVEAAEPTEEVEMAAEPEVPAYAPDYTYKVNKEVREIPEHYRSFLTDAEREKEFRDIMERADGIHDVKEHRDRLTKEISEQYAPAKQVLDQANGYLAKQDLESFFEFSGLNDKQIFEYALKKLELQENPEQAAQHSQYRQLQQQNMQLQQQFEQLQSQHSQTAVQQRGVELDTFIARPENHAIAQAYDTQVGTPGAFRSEVIRRGQYYGQVQNRDASVEELVNEVAAPLRGFVSPQQAAAQPSVTPSGVVLDGGNQRAKPALPKIQGRGGSPVSKGPRSLDDLRKIRTQKLGL